jgi:hypothetical protein
VPASSRTALVAVVLLTLVGVIVIALIHPTAVWPAQDPAYYRFADARALLGIPNFGNVISNAPFLPVGLLGLRRCARGQARAGERALFAILFGGVVLTSFGSAYFHFAPSTATLFWDRLPMTLVFTPLFTLVLADTIDPRARAALWPLVAVGVGSVLWWRVSEAMGHGDLRPYALVQAVPMAAIPLLVLLRRPPRTRTYVVVLAWYVVAKVCEVGDGRILHLFAGGVSGHSLKHVCAAIATVPMLRLCAAEDGAARHD